LQIAQFTLAAFGVLAGVAFAIGKNETVSLGQRVALLGQSNGVKEIILGYPILAFFSSILYLSNQAAIYRIGAYIRENLEKNVKKVISQSLDPSGQSKSQGSQGANPSSDCIIWWEQWTKGGRMMPYNLSRSFAAFLLFPGTQGLAIFAYLSPLLLPRSLPLNAMQNAIVWLAAGVTIATALLLLIFDLVGLENWKKFVGPRKRRISTPSF
jgi:hypothetical protein